MKLTEIFIKTKNSKKSYKKLSNYIKGLKTNTHSLINDHTSGYAHLFDQLGKKEDNLKLLKALKSLQNTLNKLNV